MASTLVLVIGALAAAMAPTAIAGDKHKKHGHRGPRGWRMPHHSFEQTLTYEDTLGDWLSSASSMALRDRFQLLPPVPDRYGIFWNKKGLDTRRFEVSFRLKCAAEPPPSVESKDALVAFWISMTNFSASFDEQKIVSTSKDWSESLQASDYTFIGNSAKFTGLGVIFSGTDGKKAPTQTITAVWGDGVKIHTLPSIIDQEPDKTKAATVVRDWIDPAKEVQVKITVHPDGAITGKMMTSAEDIGDEWQDIFQFPADTFPQEPSAKAYIGFSGYSGTSSSVEVNLNNVILTNFDHRTMGDEETVPESEERSAWAKVLSEEKRFVSQLSQKDAVERLTKLLSDHVSRFDTLGEKLKEDIVTMEARLELVGSNVANYLAATKAWSMETHSFDPKVVKAHIVGIRAVLTEDHKVHDAKLHDVHEAAKDLKKAHNNGNLNEEGKAKVQSVHEQALAVQEFAHQGSVQTNSMLLVLVVAVFGLGLLFLNRMRYYEKKHYI